MQLFWKPGHKPDIRAFFIEKCQSGYFIMLLKFESISVEIVAQ